MTSQSLPLPDPERATPEQLLAHSAWVRRLARALVGDAAAADDVVQDTWLAALRHPPAGDRPVKPWLARVVSNVARNRRRSEGRRVDHESVPPDASEPPTPDEIAASFEMQRILLDEVEKLDEPHRSTLARFYFHGASAVAIARADQVAESTVRARLAQAIEALRRKLDARHRGARGQWMAMLAPLSGRGPAVHLTSSATAAVAGSFVLMNMLVKIGIVAVVLVAGLGVYELTSSRQDALDARDKKIATGPDAPLVQPASQAPSIGETGQGASRVELGAAAPRAAPEPDGADAVVEARVIDAHGNPIAGATMTCITRRIGPAEPIAEIPAATSGADGRVRIAVQVAALPRQDPESTTIPTAWWTDAEFAATGHASKTESMTFRTGETSRWGDIVLAAGGDVAGRVVDGAGQGISSAIVTLIAPELTIEELEKARTFGLEQHGAQDEVRTSADGSFVVHGASAGAHRVWTMPGSRSCAVSDAFVLAAGARVELPPLVVDGDHFAITGIVITPDGKPCEYAQVYTATNGVRSQSSSSTGKDGRFTHKVAAGEVVELEVYADEGEAIVAGVSAGTHDLRILLTPPKWIDVHFRDRSGAPLTAFSVRIQEGPGRGGSTFGLKYQADGTRRIRVPVRPFTVTGFADGYVEQSTGILDPKQTPADIVFELEALPVLRGRVILEDHGVVGAEVTLLRVRTPDDVWTVNSVPTSLDVHHLESTTSGPDGVFSFTCRTSSKFVLTATYSDMASAVTEPFVVDAARPPTDFVLALFNGGSLEGRTLTAPGDEANFPWLQVVRETGETHTLPIEAGGAYRFDHLAPGTWWLLRVDEELKSGLTGRSGAPPNPTAREIHIVESQTTHFDLDLRTQPSPLLLGHISIAGVRTDVWTAQLTIRDSWTFTSATQPVAADGTFRLRLRATGKGHLVLSTPATADRSTRIETDVELPFGTTSWSLDIPTGSLTLTPGPETRGLLSHVTTLPNNATFTTQFQAATSTPIVLDHVAAGSSRILDAAGRVLCEVTVPINGQAQSTLR